MKLERGISHTRSLTYLGVVWGVIAGSIAVAALWPGWLSLGLALVVISSRQSALLTIAHECWHYSMFRPRRLNNVVGSVLSGWTVGSSFIAGRRRHLAHHRLLGHHDDPDFEYHSCDGKATGRQARRYFLSLVLGRQLSYILFLRRSCRTSPKGAGESRLASLRTVLPDLAGIAAAQVVLLATMWLLVGWWAYPVLWLLPLVTLTTFANGVRAFVEHYSFEGDDVSKDDRLFTIKAPWYERAFFAPMNFNFHAEHHLQPAVSSFRLPSLRDDYMSERRVILRRGYLATLLPVLFPSLGRSAAPDEAPKEARDEEPKVIEIHAPPAHGGDTPAVAGETRHRRAA